MDTDVQKAQIIKKEDGNTFFNLFKAAPVKDNIKEDTSSGTQAVQELLENIRNVRKEWEDASLNFELACENELIDYYTYRIKASEVKYAYLLRKAKEMDVKVDRLECGGFEYRYAPAK
jgi:hypothetical protein